MATAASAHRDRRDQSKLRAMAAERAGGNHNPGVFPLSAYNKSLNQGRLEECLDMLADGWVVEVSHRYKDFLELCVTKRRMDLGYKLCLVVPKCNKKGCLYSAMLSACGRAKDFKHAKLAYQHWQDSGLPLNIYGYTAYVAAASKTRNFEVAQRTYKEAVAEGHVSVYLFNAFLDACGRCGRYSLAAGVCREMEEAGVAPDVFTFNTLMSGAAGALDMGAVRAHLEEMEARGVQPQQQTYGILMSAAANNRGELPWALGLYEEMKTRGIPANNFIVSALLKACAKAEKGGEAGFEIFDEFRAVQKPNLVTFTSLVSVCSCTKQHVRAIRLLDEMEEAGIRPNTVTYSAVLAVLEKQGQWERAEMVWGRMEAAGVKPNTQTFNVMLMCYAKAKRVGKAIELFETMEAARSPPDIISYNALIHAAAKTQQSNLALNLLDQAISAGLRPNKHTMSGAVDACAANKKVEDAAGVMKRLSNLGVEADSHVYGSLIDSCSKVRDLDRGLQYFADMKAAGIRPTVVTYGCLLNCCRRQADASRARIVYEEMVAEGIVPSDDCHNLLIKTCAAARDVDVALEIVKGVVSRREEVQCATFNSLIRALVFTKKVERAMRVKSIMETMGMSPSRTATTGMVQGCCMAGRVTEGYTMYKAMREKHGEPNRKAASLLIENLSRAGHLERALWVYDDLKAHTGGTAFPRSLCVLATALAREGTFRSGEREKAEGVYGELMGMARGSLQATKHPVMFEALIELYVRGEDPQVPKALAVFDDMRRAEEATGIEVCISNTALAYLENKVKQSGADLEWRVYDIVAYMRIQRERLLDNKRRKDKPLKDCHHMGDEGDEDAWRLDSSARGGTGPSPAAAGRVRGGRGRVRKEYQGFKGVRQFQNNIGPFYRRSDTGELERRSG